MATKSQKIKNIADLAKQAASELLEAMPMLKTAAPIERTIQIIRVLDGGQNSAAKLKTAIFEDSSFGDLRDGWIQGIAFGMILQDHVLPFSLIDVAINGGSVCPIVAEAFAFAKSAKCRLEWYAPLAGITVSNLAKLESNIDLVPWADVPDGTQKKKFGPDSPNTDLAMMESGFFQMRATASSAIRVRSPTRQVLFSSREGAKTAVEVSAGEIEARTEIINDVVRCITASSVHAVSVVGNWERFDQEFANYLPGASYSYGSALFDESVHKASISPLVVDGKSIAELFHSFKGFQLSEKRVMRVALDRLNQALRRQNNVDKAIDLGIALEVMLLHGIDDNYRGELKFRTSIRGATFLGGEKPERLKTFNALKAAYDLRSKAVHSGVLKEKKKGSPSEQIFEDATRICAHIARKLIDRGSFPDWDTEYVIGADQ